MTAAGDAVAAYWAAAEDRDWDRFGALVATDVVYEAPQTRERVRGRDADADGSQPGLTFFDFGDDGLIKIDHRLLARPVRATGPPGRPDRALLTAGPPRAAYQRSWAIVS